MKKVSIFIALNILIYPLLFAQKPAKRNTAMLYKITATWCYPCGTWGWELADDMNVHFGDGILYLELFNSSSSAYNNTAFYNEAALDLAFNFRQSNWPSFGINGINLTDHNSSDKGIDIAGIKQDCYDSVAAFEALPVIANAVSVFTIDTDSILHVSTNLRFFEATEGNYYLATYIVEDGALNYQNPKSGMVAHKGVLRAAIDSLSWGSLVASGEIKANDTVSKEYSYKITDKSWDWSRLVIYNVIWEKKGTKYYYVNGSKQKQEATSIKEAQRNARLKIYPNPGKGTVHIALDKNINSSIIVSVTDIIGRQVVLQQYFNLEQAMGQQQLALNIAQLKTGIYIVKLESKAGISTGKLIVAR